MKVKDLKKILDNLPDEDLELDVAVYADHGQEVEKTDTACPEWVTKDEERSIIHEDELHDWDAEEVERVFVIGD